MNNNENAETVSNDQVDSYLYSYCSYFPDNDILYLRTMMLGISRENYLTICATPLHNPMVILLLSIFLGELGVDRFLIGDIGMGLAKLFLSGITLGIFPFIDIFFCYKRAKEINFEEVLKRIR